MSNKTYTPEEPDMNELVDVVKPAFRDPLPSSASVLGEPEQVAGRMTNTTNTPPEAPLVPVPRETCAVCNVGEREHKVSEAAGVLHHKFSRDGMVVESDPPPKIRPATAEQQVTGGVGKLPIGDPVLRWLLVSKGIISSDDIMEADKVLRSTGLLQ